MMSEKKKKKKFGGEKGCRLVGCLKFLRDDLQDVEDQLHDHRALAQLTRPAVNDGDQSAVQVAQVLRQERLAVASDQITHLRRMKGWSHTKDLVSTGTSGRFLMVFCRFMKSLKNNVDCGRVQSLEGFVPRVPNFSVCDLVWGNYNKLGLQASSVFILCWCKGLFTHQDLHQ